MMLVQIGVFIMAISFAIFAIALSRLLLRASSSIEAIQTATGQMEAELDGTLQALDGTLEETNGTLSDMEAKLNAVDSVFLSVEEFGNAANIIGQELDEVTEGHANAEDLRGAKPFIRIIQSAELVKGLLESWKRGIAFTENREGRS